MNADELVKTAQGTLQTTCTGCARSIQATSMAERCPHCGGLLFAHNIPLACGFSLEEKYEIQEQIGVGAWGTVYRAKQIGLNRDVAVKLLHRHLVANRDKFERFRLEAHSLKQLNHEGVAAIYDVGVFENEAGEQPYFVQEFVRGITLRDILRNQKLTGEQIKNLFAQILDVLVAAHGKGIVHRDIKPSNIVVSDFETRPSVRLLDFGIAKLTLEENEPALTATGDLLGTPLYMSPEQCVGDAIDNRSDLYAVGCLLYEAVAGKSPFWAESSIACMMKHVNEAPPDLNEHGVDQSYIDVIEKALQKLVDDRFQSATEFREAVLALPDVHKVPTKARKPAGLSPKTKLLAAVGAVLLTCSIAVLGWLQYVHQQQSMKPEVVNLTAEPAPPADEKPMEIRDLTSAPKITSAPYFALLPPDVARRTSALCSDGTPTGYYLATNKLLHFDGVSKKLTTVAESFPNAGAGFAYSPEEKLFYVFGRTETTPGFLRSLYRIDAHGVPKERLALRNAIPTADGGDQQLESRWQHGHLEVSIPEASPQGWLNVSIDPKSGLIKRMN